ncbi:iron-sulfur cluster assembly protein, partial [Turicimonas muris]
MDEKIEQKVRHLLKEVVDPNTGKDLVASKSVKKIEDVDDKLKILIDLD